jgi:hypothetical protein
MTSEAGPMTALADIRAIAEDLGIGTLTDVHYTAGMVHVAHLTPPGTVPCREATGGER